MQLLLRPRTMCFPPPRRRPPLVGACRRGRPLPPPAVMNIDSFQQPHIKATYMDIASKLFTFTFTLHASYSAHIVDASGSPERPRYRTLWPPSQSCFAGCRCMPQSWHHTRAPGERPHGHNYARPVPLSAASAVRALPLLQTLTPKPACKVTPTAAGATRAARPAHDTTLTMQMRVPAPSCQLVHQQGRLLLAQPLVVQVSAASCVPRALLHAALHDVCGLLKPAANS